MHRLPRGKLHPGSTLPGEASHWRETAMRKSILPLAFAAFVIPAVPAHAADVAAGKALAEEACADCHGDDTYPAITGMTVEKFAKAMKEYQDGTRTKSAKMTTEAKKLSAAQIADLAAYYATLE